jgi:chemotaxis protein MotB
MVGPVRVARVPAGRDVFVEWNLWERCSMPANSRHGWLLAVASLAIVGCGQNPFLTPQQQSAVSQQQTAYVSQVAELQRRANELDVSNRDLHTQLAQAQQQMKIYQDQVNLLQKQLGETAEQLRETQLARQDAEKNVKMLQASTRQRGGAMITANNSLRKNLSSVDIPGVEVRQELDVIRIALPADELFQRGTAQLLPAGYASVDRVADAIMRNYPRQRVAVEGHTDSAPVLGGGGTDHQLSAMQALAVFDLLTRRNRLPVRQLFVIGMGANHPRSSNATEAGRATNRRVELVIYPQTID